MVHQNCFLQADASRTLYFGECLVRSVLSQTIGHGVSSKDPVHGARPPRPVRQSPGVLPRRKVPRGC